MMIKLMFSVEEERVLEAIDTLLNEASAWIDGLSRNENRYVFYSLPRLGPSGEILTPEEQNYVTRQRILDVRRKLSLIDIRLAECLQLFDEYQKFKADGTIYRETSENSEEKGKI